MIAKIIMHAFLKELGQLLNGPLRKMRISGNLQVYKTNGEFSSVTSQILAEDHGSP